MYLDKLDGRIDNDFFDRKAAEFRSEQCRVPRDIDMHRNASQSYIEEGIRLLDLAQRAPVLFENRPAEKTKAARFCTPELPVEGWTIRGGISEAL